MSRLQLHKPWYLVGFALLGAILGAKQLGVWQDEVIYNAYYAMGSELPTYEILKKTDVLFYFIIRGWSSLGLVREDLWIALGAFSLSLTCLCLLRASEGKRIVIIIYFCFLAWVQVYTQVRMALALAICLCSYYMWPKPNAIAWVLRIMACLIHASMLIIILPALILSRTNLKQKTVFVWCLGGGILALLFSRGILPYLPFDRVVVYYKLLQEGTHSDINLFSALPAIELIALLYMAFISGMKQEVNSIEYKLALLGAVSFYAFSAVPVFSVRVNELLGIMFIITIARTYRRDAFLFCAFLAYVGFALKSTYLLLTSNLT